MSSFFGVDGRFRLHGGGRGRVFVVSGLLYDPTTQGVAVARNNILTYDDGIGRVLYDATENYSWPAVVFTGVCQWTGDYGIADDGGSVVWVRPYTAVFEGMI